MARKKNIRADLAQVRADIEKLERVQTELKAKRLELSALAAQEDAEALFEAIDEFAKQLREGEVFDCYQRVMGSWEQLSEHDPGALSKFGRKDSYGVPDSEEKQFLVEYFLQYLPRFDSIIDAIGVLKKGEGKPGNIFLHAPKEEQEVAA